MSTKAKNRKPLIIAAIVFVVLVVTGVVIWQVTAPKGTAGAKAYTLTVVDADGKETVHNLNTDEETLGAAWLFRKMESRLGWGLLCGFYGLIFGTLTAIPVLILSGPAATLAYIISGIPFDLIHGVSNFLLAFLLLPTLRRILARLTRTLNMGTLYFE